MSRLYFFQGLIKNLNEEININSRAYLTKEEALEMLKKITGVDYGFDVDLWKKHIRDIDKKVIKKEE
jgi:hypothetical protein